MSTLIRRSLALLLCLLILPLAGCGSDDDVSVLDDGAAGETGIIIYNTVLAKAVPSSVVQFRFSGNDASGTPVFGPSFTAKQPSIELIVPRSLTRLTVEYLDSTGAVVGIVNVNVNLSGGGPVTITDPDFISPGGEATQVDIITQPSNVGEGSAITPPIRVAVADANGAVVSTSDAAITLTLGANPGNATLGGTLTVNAVNGIATFSDITLNNSGSGYTLVASSGDLSPDTSTAFNVLNVGAPDKLAFVGEIANATEGAALTGVSVVVQDVNGLTVTTADTLITVAIANNPNNGNLSGTLEVAAVNGVATFSDLAIDMAGVGYTLEAVGGNLEGATSEAFDILDDV